MKIHEDMQRLREEMKAYIDQRLANTIEYTQYSRSSKIGTGDKTKGHKTEGDEKEYDHEVQRLQHFGLRSLPPKDTWCIRLGAAGGGTNGVVIAEDGVDRYGPQDLEDGEIAIYNKATGCVVKLTAAGKVEITAKSGQDVVVNGGTAKVARVGDKTTNHLHAAGTLLDSLGVPVTGSTAVTQPSIVEGADHFKG